MQEIPTGYKLISSTFWTIFLKWVLSIGIIGLFCWMMVVEGSRALIQGRSDLWFTTAFALAMCILWIVLACIDWRILMDQVYASGNGLLIVNYGKIRSIRLDDIERMKFNRGFRGPSFVYLWLKHTGSESVKIRFIPKGYVTEEKDLRKMLKELEQVT